MPDNNNTGEIEVVPWDWEDDWTLSANALQPTITTHTQGAITNIPQPTVGGLMEAIQNQAVEQYISHDIDKIHREFLKTWGIAYPEKPVTKLIKDDEDMKASSNKDMKPLEKEEIERASWTQQPNEFFLKDLLEDNKASKLHPIGRIGQGNLERVPGKGRCVYLILAHRLDGITVTTNKQSSEVYKSGVNREYIVYNLTEKKIQLYDGSILENYFSSSNSQSIVNNLNKYFKYKIIGSTLSGRTFGLGKSKEKLVGTIPEDVKLEFGDSVRLGGSTWYAVVGDVNTGHMVKFCLSDLEIILPNIKGYNFPKDKTINLGTSVVIKANTDKVVYKVSNIYPNMSSQRLKRNSKTRKLDVLLLVNKNNAYDTHKVYAKNVKVVE